MQTVAMVVDHTELVAALAAGKQIAAIADGHTEQAVVPVADMLSAGIALAAGTAFAVACFYWHLRVVES